MPRRSATAFLACATACALAACGGTPRADRPSPDGACDVVPAAAAGSRDTSGDARPVVVGMHGAVDPANAPVPRNAAERLVFPQLYETLVRLRCDGRIEPALASTWRAEDGGRRWVFTLRADARDWTGAPVTARDVAESWLASPDAPGPRPTGPHAPRFASLTVLDARTLSAQVEAPVPLHWFARPELAVRTATRAGGWPGGTGPLRPETDAPASGPLRRLVLRPAAGGSIVEFRAVDGDPRNAVDAGMDLLATRDPAVADYAAASGTFLVLPLAWDRSYVLLSPRGAALALGAEGRARAPGSPDRPRVPLVVLPPDSVLRALARDAVRVDARPARETFAGADACSAVARPAAWAGGAGAGGHGGGVARAGSTGRPGGGAARSRAGVQAAPQGLLLYPPGDPVAQALAGRLVALAPEAGGGGGAGWLAEAAPVLARAGEQARAGTVGREDLFADALRRGAGPFVVRLDRVAGMGPCDAVAALTAAAPWLGEAAEGATAAAAAAADLASVDAGDLPRLVPLIETRPALIVRRGVGGVAVDGRGTLLLGRVHRTAGGSR